MWPHRDPLPSAEVEETDELLLADPEDLVGLDPDALPRRLLHDFAFYNAEVRAACLLSMCCSVAMAGW